MAAKYYANAAVVMVGANGQPTAALLLLLRDYERRLAASEAQMAAIAAVTAPSGGATVDAEARTAIAAIIAGAA